MSKQTMPKKRTQKSRPNVAVIIPVFKERIQIKECIVSLTRQTYPQKSMEIIVVIDGKGDKQIKKSLEAMDIPNLRVFLNKGHGSASARNLGTSLADKKTNYFAFTDADCITSKNWITTLVNAIEKSPGRVGCVGGENITPKTDSSFAQIIGYLEQTLLGGGGSTQGSKVIKKRRVASIPNCNALYRTEWWHSTKQDENFITGQDGEFNYRIAQKGCCFLVVPGAEVLHHRPSSVIVHVRRMYKYGLATSRIFKKHPSILRIRWYALPPVFLVLGSIGLGILGIVFSFAWSLLAFGMGLYVALILLSAFQVAFLSGMWQSIFVFLVLPAAHISYAIGFLKGLFH